MDLIERLAQRIADKILADALTVASIDVTVHKPHAPIVVLLQMYRSPSRATDTDNGRTAESMPSITRWWPWGNVGEVESTCEPPFGRLTRCLAHR